VRNNTVAIAMYQENLNEQSDCNRKKRIMAEKHHQRRIEQQGESELVDEPLENSQYVTEPNLNSEPHTRMFEGIHDNDVDDVTHTEPESSCPDPVSKDGDSKDDEDEYGEVGRCSVDDTNSFVTSKQHGELFGKFISFMHCEQQHCFAFMTKHRNTFPHEKDQTEDQDVSTEINQPRLYRIVDSTHVKNNTSVVKILARLPAMRDTYKDKEEVIGLIDKVESDNAVHFVKLGCSTTGEGQLLSRYGTSFAPRPSLFSVVVENGRERVDGHAAEGLLFSRLAEFRLNKPPNPANFEGFPVYFEGKYMVPVYDAMLREVACPSCPEEIETEDIARDAYEIRSPHLPDCDKSESLLLLKLIEISASVKYGKTSLWLADRTMPLRILWIGCKDINSVLYFHRELKQAYPDLLVAIIVIEDIKSCAIPTEYENAINGDIKILTIDFMGFGANELFDMMHVSIKQSLSKCLKLKVFYFASQHFRLKQPFIISGHPDLFDLNFEADESGTARNFFPKKATDMVEVYDHQFSSLMTIGELFWGPILQPSSKTNFFSPFKLLAELKESLVGEMNRTWNYCASCANTTKWLPPFHNITTSNVSFPGKLFLQFLSRTLVMTVSLKDEPLPGLKHSYEVKQTIIYQVSASSSLQS